MIFQMKMSNPPSLAKNDLGRALRKRRKQCGAAKWRIFLLLGFSIVLSVQAQENSDTYSGVLIKRPAIVVTDLDRALLLFRDVLGLSVNSISTEDSDSLAYDLFNVPPGAQLRFATLDAGEIQRRTYGLLEISGVEVKAQSGLRRAGVVINANGRWEEIRMAVNDLGLTLLREKKLVTSDQRIGIETGFVDWDGNLIIIYQLPK